MVVARNEFLGPFSVLPVTLVEFRGIKDGNNTKLFWTAENQINTLYYDIEFSTDGINFNKRGTIPARINNSINSYSFEQVSATANISYYRLKIVDSNGKFTYSKTLMFRNDISLSEKSVYPNPFINYITISIRADQKSSGVITLSDFSGKMISTRNVQVEKGINNISLDNLPEMAAGNYILTVTENGNKTLLHILKQ